MNVTRAPCRTNLDDRVGKLKIAERFGDMITADQKVLIDDHETNMQWQDLAIQRIQSYHCKTNQLRRRREALENSYIQKKIHECKQAIRQHWSVVTSRKLEGRSNGVYCLFRDVQAPLGDGETPYER